VYLLRISFYIITVHLSNSGSVRLSIYIIYCPYSNFVVVPIMSFNTLLFLIKTHS
jgi:hypothetical protein